MNYNLLFIINYKLTSAISSQTPQLCHCDGCEYGCATVWTQVKKAKEGYHKAEKYQTDLSERQEASEVAKSTMQ